MLWLKIDGVNVLELPFTCRCFVFDLWLWWRIRKKKKTLNEVTWLVWEEILYSSKKKPNRIFFLKWNSLCNGPSNKKKKNNNKNNHHLLFEPIVCSRESLSDDRKKKVFEKIYSHLHLLRWLSSIIQNLKCLHKKKRDW